MIRTLPVFLFLIAAQLASAALDIAPDHPALLYSGRRAVDAAEASFSWSGSRVRIAFRGDALSVRLAAERRGVHVNLYLDGLRVQKLALDPAETVYPLVAKLAPDRVHTVELVVATESFIGACHFRGFILPEGATIEPWPVPETRRIKFIGDSITCGYGIEASGPDQPFRPEEENFCLTYSALTARALRADYHVVARSGIGIHRNYGAPREGSPDAMPALFDRLSFRHAKPSWDHSAFSPDLICLNLGTNDWSGPARDEDAYEEAAVAFVARLLDLHPRAKILLLFGPMQNAGDLRERLARVRERTAPERIGLFALSPQGKLGFGAHHHPSAAQAEYNAAELTRHIAEWMNWPVEN